MWNTREMAKLALTATGMRCIYCKKEMKADDEFCRGCGDRLMPAEKPETPVPPARAGITLTAEQQCAIEAIKAWFPMSGQASLTEPFRLFGPAGTGKTTLVKAIGPALGIQPVFGAYTGKAAHVLRRKGVPATTIHSAIYAPRDTFKLHARHRELTTELGTAGPLARQALEAELAEIERELAHPRFDFKGYMSEWAGADLIVLDEVSMVTRDMAWDLEKLNVPILVLGDPAQLPPIEGAGHYVAAEPDVLLTEVHRQALESPVLKLATDIRLGHGWRDALVKVDLEEAMAADQIIVWKNATRWNLTGKIRARLGRPAGEPVAGDRVMCLVNNKDIGVLNGMQYDVLEVRGGPKGSGTWELKLRDDEGREVEHLARAGGFKDFETEQAEKRAGAWRGPSGLFTFANVITCHKAQGSEWDSVYVVDQTHQMWKSTEAEKRAWAYTATTRASEKVTLASTAVR